MKYYAALTGAVFTIFLGTFNPLHVYACTPAPGYPQTAAESLPSKDAAFIGTVTSRTQDAGTDGKYHVEFTIDTPIKGDLGTSTTITVQSSSAACGYDDGATKFAPGAVWAIFATGSGATGYVTNSLSGNTPYASVEEARASLSSLIAASPVSSTSTMAAVSVPMKDLAVGSRGTAVVWLQNYLIARATGAQTAALGSVGATGYFGERTRAALAEYQKANGIIPAVGYFGLKTRAFVSANLVPPSGNPEAAATTFTGVISAVDTGCFSDATCSVTVAGKKVVLATGMRIGVSTIPAGTLKGVESIGDLEGKIGSTARVYAATLADGSAGYTIIGSSDYYVQLVGDVPPSGAITIQGTTDCLPVSDPHQIHTLVCAIGLQGDDGNYYALRDTDASYANISSVGTGTHVRVTGTFTPGATAVYANVGTIDVASLKKS